MPCVGLTEDSCHCFQMHLNEIKTSFEEWDRRGASELKLSEFDQLTR